MQQHWLLALDCCGRTHQLYEHENIKQAACHAMLADEIMLACKLRSGLQCLTLCIACVTKAAACTIYRMCHFVVAVGLHAINSREQVACASAPVNRPWHPMTALQHGMLGSAYWGRCAHHLLP